MPLVEDVVVTEVVVVDVEVEVEPPITLIQT